MNNKYVFRTTKIGPVVLMNMNAVPISVYNLAASYDVYRIYNKGDEAREQYIGSIYPLYCTIAGNYFRGIPLHTGNMQLVITADEFYK